MNTETVELQRARRRYKALLRERETQVATGTVDPVVAAEIMKLEEKHAELRPPAAPSQTPPTPEAQHPVPPASPSPQAAACAPGAEAGVAAVRLPSIKLAVKPPALQPCAPPDDDESRGAIATRPATGASPPAVRLDGYLVMFLFRVFNETQQRSQLGQRNGAAVAALSAAVAVWHCTLLDPSSAAGALMTPSLMCCLVHTHNLLSLYMQQQQQQQQQQQHHPSAPGRRRLTVPLLLVYVCLDVVPSLALALAAYHVTVTVLGLVGARPASFSC
ncbi:hypothetical protein NESM_000406300 [Novymonas esmeraldas]|uniref:Uncharacterized protein n=1 Tax=Novymonas esmeraldas TaxID=1808958 RepID=A0AAW0EPQ3_9TRYP